MSANVYIALLAVVACERMVELHLSHRHAAILRERGAVEVGQRHYLPMVALHTALLVGAAAEVSFLDRPFLPELGVPMIIAAATAQALRWWAIRTLGVHWNTRVIVVPGVSRIQAGPYRFVSHPNYVAVVVEGLALPLVHSAWITASIFFVLNAWLLSVRIRTEEIALDVAEAT